VSAEIPGVSSAAVAGNLAGAQAPVSVLLTKIKSDIAGRERVSVGDLLRAFGLRGFAFLLLALALLNLVVFMLPGLSVLFGLPMVYLAAQMVMGRKAPLLPSFLTRQTVGRALLVKGLEEGSAKLSRIEPYLRPRLPLLTGPFLDRLHSLVALLLACMVALPIPFVNMPPSVALIVLGLGIMQRDGVFVIFAYLLAGWSLWIFGTLRHIALAFIA
jgi:hypothetical protein